MLLYEIALPIQRNDGTGYYDYRVQRQMWQNHALQLTGGFTSLGERSGAWKDPDSGDVFWETMHWYQLAVEGDQIIADLVEKAGELFPDQLAFFVAKIGTAENVSMAKNFAEAMS